MMSHDDPRMGGESSSLKKDPWSWLYPHLEPYRTGTLKVSGGHEIYFEECGNPTGKPTIFVHGGPGGGTDPKQRRFFNPQKYRIILFDQRGCGKSMPHASLENNTTWDLVNDMEVLREHLGITRWQVFGGSWGSTLALTYAIQHPARVTELVLRGIFLLRKGEIDWFYRFGASEVFPDAWEAYRDLIPPEERGDMVAAYYKRLTSADQAVRLQAAKTWSIWEGYTSQMYTDLAEVTKKFGQDQFAEAFARIECHYFMNDGFFPSSNYLLEHCHTLRNIPIVIVQGRYDMVCPATSAWALHKALPHSELFLVPDAGHSVSEPGNSRQLVAATDRFATVSS